MVVAVVLILIRIGYAYRWTGFGPSQVNEAVQPSKTLWDWLDLLIVPIVLAVGGYLFNRTENQRTQETTDQQRKLDHEIAEERRQDDMLQAYLDGMSELLTDKEQPLRLAQRGDNLSALARARTLTLLPRLDSNRKRSALQFLYESDLITKEGAFVSDSKLIETRQTVVDLRGADLNGALLSTPMNLLGANLGAVNLKSANLSGALLREADIGSANLKSANLSDALLGKANLFAADLSGSDLRRTFLDEAFLVLADLREADLREAVLSEADLRKTDLTGTDLRSADLSGADLQGAYIETKDGSTQLISNSELAQKEIRSLEGATMPNGQKYEDWLKDKESRGGD